MSSLPVLDRKGKKIDSVELPAKVFEARVRTGVLHQAVVKYAASQRQGTAATKTRSEVSGGGIKPYRQKGTGRARAGSLRSPLFYHGGVVFGPQPRDFGYKVPKTVKKTALRESLNAKFQSQEMLCIEELTTAFKKTKEFAALLGLLKLKGKTLALLDGSDESVWRVSRNIPYLRMMRSEDVNAYDILRSKNLLLTKTALKKLIKRISPSS